MFLSWGVLNARVCKHCLPKGRMYIEWILYRFTNLPCGTSKGINRINKGEL